MDGRPGLGGTKTNSAQAGAGAELSNYCFVVLNMDCQTGLCLCGLGKMSFPAITLRKPVYTFFHVS